MKQIVYPRIGLIGNPSDGYGGATIAFTFKNFKTEINLKKSKELKITPAAEDRLKFKNLTDLNQEIETFGYYGGVRLIKAAINKFYKACRNQGIKLKNKNFSISYQTNIPRQVGLAASSAIIIATLKSLIKFFNLAQNSFPKPILADLALKSETEELDLAAGLQDRVAQVYNDLVYMDFSRRAFRKNNGLFGEYQRLDKNLLPNLAIIFCPEASESYRVHHNLKSRFESGEKKLRKAMQQTYPQITLKFRKALEKRNISQMEKLINQNFNLRQRLLGKGGIGEKNLEMISSVRKLGLSAKFAGSGGTAVTILKNEKEDLKKLKKIAKKLNLKVEKVIL